VRASRTQIRNAIAAQLARPSDHTFWLTFWSAAAGSFGFPALLERTISWSDIVSQQAYHAYYRPRTPKCKSENRDLVDVFAKSSVNDPERFPYCTHRSSIAI
jgi:hypothetical protein